MKDLKKYQGIFPAFYACYDDSGAVCPERVRKFTRYLIGKGVTGLYVGGSSGECIYQSVAERKLLLENVMAEAAGKIVIIAHGPEPCFLINPIPFHFFLPTLL